LFTPQYSWNTAKVDVMHKSINHSCFPTVLCLAELLLFLFCHSTFQILVWIQHFQFFFLWKESLNNDGHQFHQYQQNNELTEYKKIPQHMTLEIQVLAWDRHKNVTGLNYLMGPQQTSITYIWDIKSYYKNLQCRLIKSPMTNLGLKYNPKQIFTWII